MNFDAVTLEFTTFITVANIEAPTGAHAIAIATDLVDQQFLINTPSFKNPEPDMSAGTLLSIAAAKMAKGGSVSTDLNQTVERVTTSYRVLKDGSIETSTRPSETDIASNVRKAHALLDEALLRNPVMLSEACHRVKDLLMQTGLLTFPKGPEEALSAYLNEEVSEEPSHVADDSFPEPETGSYFNAIESEFLQKITDLVPPESERRVRLTAPIFVTSTQVQQSEAHKPEPGWTVDFGEISVSHPSGKLASIGNWRRFAAEDAIYFDEEELVNAARSALLHFNGIDRFFIAKPDLPGEISMELMV